MRHDHRSGTAPAGPRWRTRFLAGLALAGLAVAGLPAAPAGAQDPEAEEEAPVTTPAPAEVPPPSAPVDEFERGTPRSAVHHYLVACREGDFQRAAHYLQLRRIPEPERAKRGPELARDLKIVLDRKLWVETERLSNDPEGHPDDGLPAGRDLVGYIENAADPKPIYLDRVAREDGVRVWKISADTVRQIPELYDEFGYGLLGAWLPPIFFEGNFLEIQLWQWLGLLGVIFAAYLLSWFVARGVVTAIRPLVSRSSSTLDDHFLQAVIGPLRILVAALLFYLSLGPLALSIPAETFFVNTTKVAGLFAATWFVMRLIDVFADIAEESIAADGDPGRSALIPLGRKTVKVAIGALAILASLDSFGFDVTALIAGLGVGGLAVALAAQKTVENLFGGATLIADRPVEVGDFCRFGDKVGTVEEIGMRSTRIRTLDRTVVSVPNAEFSSLQLENFGKRDMMRYAPTIGLLYATTPDQLRYVLVELRRMLYAHPKVLEDPARVRFVSFGDFSLNLEIFAYVAATDYSEFLGIVEDLNLRVMDIVAESGTGFAFPSNTTYVARDDGPDPERTRRAEEKVKEWSEQGELFLPGFPRERIQELRRTLDYPIKGAPPNVSK